MYSAIVSAVWSANTRRPRKVTAFLAPTGLISLEPQQAGRGDLLLVDEDVEPVTQAAA